MVNFEKRTPCLHPETDLIKILILIHGSYVLPGIIHSHREDEKKQKHINVNSIELYDHYLIIQETGEKENTTVKVYKITS